MDIETYNLIMYERYEIYPNSSDIERLENDSNLKFTFSTNTLRESINHNFEELLTEITEQLKKKNIKVISSNLDDCGLEVEVQFPEI